jgi:dsRNA-specific ribonuclease/ERCC4-related helicase
MNSFYHPRKSQGLLIPHILGLTASPVMRSDPLSLEKIEQTLDAVARTPTKHRAELRLHVNLPVLLQVFYQRLPPPEHLTRYTRTIESLGQIYLNLSIDEDPYVLHLINENTEKSKMELQKVMQHHKTRCQRQMYSFHSTSLKISQEMGAYGADWYTSEVVKKCIKVTDGKDSFLEDWDLSTAEKIYLAKALRQVKLSPMPSLTPAAMLISDKVTKLIDLMVQESSTIRGIIFVQTRAEVAVLFQILSVHPRTQGCFRIGTMVGTSAHKYRTKNIGELIDVNSQKHTLSLFKAGTINLVIATSVLEEGIDVPACNMVVCFQKPANLKSFVQRRGRARHRESKLILLLDPDVDKINDWQQLEMNMKKLYEDEMRALNEVLVLEDAEQHDGREFRIDSTGALLDLDNAMSHLYHFCATLPAKKYVDLRPDFICSSAGPSFVQCRVVLPLSVNEELRRHQSRTSWLSEKNAMKDAAFEAYLALYRAGLVNDNLLPLLRHDGVADDQSRSEAEKRAAIMNVEEQMNPWIEVAKACKPSGNTLRRVVSLTESSPSTFGQNCESSRGVERFGMNLKVGVYLPVELPPVKPFQLYWNAMSEMSVTISSESSLANQVTLQQAREDTWAILEASFGNLFQIEKRQLPIQFSPENGMPAQLSYQPVRDSIQVERSSGLIRDNNNDMPYQFAEWLPRQPPIEEVQNPYEDYSSVSAGVPHLSVIPFPRRSDLLHRLPISNQPPSAAKAYSVVLPISHCAVADIPFRIVQFGRLIPSIMRRLEIILIANQLCQTLLKDVGINNLDLVVTAISASSAQEDSNYQRLEFLGDSVLKTCTSVQLIAEYPLWHEGYLSAKKERLISNSRLSKAAIETGLDKFIITKAFAGHKWRPQYVDDLLNATPVKSKRNLSSKVLADVVEALIGASMVDGGIPKALRCLRVFLPELDWQPVSLRQDALIQRVPDTEIPPTLRPLEVLLGYTFSKKALLIESMTHASSTTGSQSLERLEFLGDSILDDIVVAAMWKQERELSQFEMHLLRTVLVNADFLAFICMEWATQQEVTNLVEVKTSGEDGKTVDEFQEVSTTMSLPLWRFMRHMSPQLGEVQVATAKRHEELRDEINNAIQHGTHYPWALLAKLQAPKFYSDIVESLLGAVWIDSRSVDVCREIVDRMGILPYMRRILKEKVQIWHPREEIGVLAHTKTVKYVVEKRMVEGSEQGEGSVFWCKIFVGEREVVEMGGGISSEEVKTKAAERAVQILNTRKLERTVGTEMAGVDSMEDGEEETRTNIDTEMSV